MKRGHKNKVVILTTMIIIILACFIGLYLLNRSINVNNNDLLMCYETLKPLSFTEEKIGDSRYSEYNFGEDVGNVVVVNDGVEVTIKDQKHGFIKSYRYGVLYYVEDMKKENLLAELKSYLDPQFWFGGGREIGFNNEDNFIRTIDECKQIGDLLNNKRYDEITKDHKNKLLLTGSGTHYVN